MKKSHTIHDLPPYDRPRERLRKVGTSNLSAQELLALIIERGGTAPKGQGRSVLTIAQNLLIGFGNLQRIREASLQELQQVKGIGFATACKLKASFEIGERAQNSTQRYGQKMESPKQVFDLLKKDLASKKKEHFKVLSLNTNNCLISVDSVSVGTLNSALAHPREIFGPPIKNSAAFVILVHNHPSDHSQPSHHDLKLTAKFFKAAQLLGIPLLDHIILSKNGFTSLKENYSQIFKKD